MENSRNMYHITQHDNLNSVGVHNGPKIINYHHGLPPGQSAENDHALVKEKRKDDESCKWLLEKDSFARCIRVEGREPKDCRSSVLWIYGKVGCGKSTLMSRVIDHIKELEEKDMGHLLFFYVGFRDEKHDSWRTMISTFWSQASPAKEQNDFSDARTTRENQDGLIEFLATAKRPIYVVVDALDQLHDENQNDVFCGLQALSRRFFEGETNSCLTIVVSSRHAPSWAEFEVHQKLDIEVSPSDTLADIESYLRNHLDQHLLYKNGEFLIERSQREGLKDHIIKKLVRHADGMFLWVQLQAHLICQAISPSGVKNHLKKLTLPSEMEKMYQDLVESFEKLKDDQARRTALGTIALLVHGEGSFSQLKLRAAFVPPSDNLQSPKLITRLCQSLVEFSEALGVFRFCHVSIYDYFRKWDKMDTVIAEISLAHLCFSDFARGPFEGALWYDPGELQEFVNIHPFLEFAACNWASSTARTPKDNRQDLMYLLENLCMLDDEQEEVDYEDTGEESESIDGDKSAGKDVKFNLHLSFQVYLLSCEESMASGVRLVHIVSFFGLTDFFDWFHSKGWLDPKATDGDGLTAIHWAIRGSSTNDMSLVIEKLVQYGGHVDSQDIERRTPLHYASKRGDLNAVTMLLKNNAALNLLSKSGTTALIAAALEDHCPTVLKLIDSGADVTTRSSSGTALSAISLIGCDSCAEAILKKLRGRVDRHPFAEEISCPDTALHNAAFRGNTEIVKLLLAENFDVNVASSKFGTALTAAAVGCFGQKDSTPYREICKMLLEKGVDVNSTGGRNEPALRAAAIHGDEHLVKLLLQHGADVNAAGCLGTAYQAAITGDHTRIQEILVAHGAKIEKQLEENHRQSLLLSERAMLTLFETTLQPGSRRLTKLVIEKAELIFRFYIKLRKHSRLEFMATVGEKAFAIVVSRVITKEARRRGSQNYDVIGEDKERIETKGEGQNSRMQAAKEETGSKNSQELENGLSGHAREETQEPEGQASTECSSPKHDVPESGIASQHRETSDILSALAAWARDSILCCCCRASTDGDEETSRAHIPTTQPQAQETTGQLKALPGSRPQCGQPARNHIAVPSLATTIQRTHVADAEQDQSATDACKLPVSTQLSLSATSNDTGCFPMDGYEDFFPFVLDQLTQVAVSILQYAIARTDPKAIDIVANSWTTALQNLVVSASFGEGLLERVVKSRTEDLRQHLTNTKLSVTERFERARQLAEVGVELLLAAVKGGADHVRLATILSRLWVSAVDAVEELGADGQRHVQDLVEIFAERFRAATTEEEAEVLANSGIDILKAAALSPNKSLMNKFVLIWVREWQGANDRGMENMTKRLLKCKLQEYEEHIRKERYRDARCLAVAGVGLLRASIEMRMDKVKEKLLETINDGFNCTLGGGLVKSNRNPQKEAPDPEIAMYMECALESVAALFAVAEEKKASLGPIARTLSESKDLQSVPGLKEMIERLTKEAQQRHHGDGYHLGPKQVSSAVAFYNSIMRKEDR